mmetsp:Transcript_7687/g.14007  ORF Transcript_7687/g.14007 Transcript_7687/m.14007 type:complete len:145 (-) Transcript_7687:66-500(-)
MVDIGAAGGGGGGGTYDARTASPWGSHVRFRVPLPDQASGLPTPSSRGGRFMNNGGGHSGGAAGGTTVAFTKGPPQMIYVGVYQKRPMVGDAHLGDLEVPLSALTDTTPLEQWLPLRRGGQGGSWFLHLRATLRFVPLKAASAN